MAELVDALDLGSSVERRAGSSPVEGTKEADVAQLVEHILGMDEVTSSIPVIGSNTCLGGGIGRHARLKLWWTEMSVWVRVPFEVLKMESDPRRRVGPPAKRDVR